MHPPLKILDAHLLWHHRRWAKQNKAVLEPRVSPAFAITYFCNHCNIILDLKIHQSMWIQWPFFPKTWTKGHWPLDDLWPHICWGHMCDSTQGSLCPSAMGIYQCMWIQWSILQITTYIHILHTTYIHTYYVQNEWSHSLLLNSVQARQKLIFYYLNACQYKNDCRILGLSIHCERSSSSILLCGSHQMKIMRHACARPPR